MSKSHCFLYLGRPCKKAAEIIVSHTGADLLEIEPVTAYSRNYNAVGNQAKDEIKKRKT